MHSNGNGDQTIRFGPFELKLRSGELYRDGVAVKLPPQPFKVLALLVEQAGQLVTREEFQQQIWGNDTYVDFDRGLNFCIKQIREALGDQAQSPEYIETLPRRGYRFIAPVEYLTASSIEFPLEGAETHQTELPSPDVHPQFEKPSSQQVESKPASGGKLLRVFQWQTLAIALIVSALAVTYVLWRRFNSQASLRNAKIMLAVLPFENLSGDAEQDYFSDGLTEEMITQLGRLQPQRLGVIARTTALTYKHTKKDIHQIGQELGVNYVLEGSVRREADRVRITAQLIQVSDQTHLWAESYERNERDLMQLQSEVAGRVASSLALELLPSSQPDIAASKTSVPEAYDAYLKGKYLVTKDTVPDIERSITYFDQATEKDPNFAAARAAAVDARVLLGAIWKNTPATELLPKAKADALKAIELDPTLAEAYAAMGAVNFWFEWNWPEAEKNLKRALVLNPSNPNTHLAYADYLLVKGQTEAGINEVKQAVKLDPVSLLTNGLAAFFYLRARHYDEAIAQANRMLELEPKSPAAHNCLSSAYLYQGKYEEALEIIRSQMTKAGAKPEAIAALGKGTAKDFILDQRRRNLERLQAATQKGSTFSALNWAGAYINLGEHDKAFEYLEKAFALREPALVFLAVDPRYDSIRLDPRYTDLVRRLKLAP